MKSLAIHSARILLGLVFLVSAVAKAWGANDFADIVLQYGAPWLTGFVPVLIAVETLLAILLLMRVAPRYTGIASAAFVAGVSAVFLYGVLFRGVTDCGCFGSISWLQMNPVWVFVRNAGLLLLSLPIILWDDCELRLPPYKAALLAVVTSVVTFVAGLAMSSTFQLPRLGDTRAAERMSVEDSGLAAYLPALSPDSVYAVYLFSYTCAHCQNSYANAEQYYTMHVVDRAFGLAIADSAGRERFERLYQPTMPVYEVSEEQMASLTTGLPLLLIIRNGKVDASEGGSITSPGIFRP